MAEIKKPLLSLSDSEEGSEITMGTNEKVPKIWSCRIKRPSFCSRLIFVVGMAVLFIFVILFILKCVEVDHQVDALTRDNEFLRGRVSDMEILVQRFIANKTDRILNEIVSTKTGIRPTQNTEHDLQESFEEMKGHLNELTFVAGNLSMKIRKMNASSDSKLSRLCNKFKETKRDMSRLHSKLIQLNESLHSDIPPSFVSAVKILNQDLQMLRNSTRRNISEIWERWNRTNVRIGGILKLVAKQNETGRLKIAYRPENLYSRLKHVENMQTEFRKNSVEIFKEFRGELNRSRDNSERQIQNLTNQISGVNENLHKALENVEHSIAALRSSLAGIHKKVDGMKKELQDDVDALRKEQGMIKNDFQETKNGFQEKQRSFDSRISDQATEVNTVKENIKQNLDSATRRLSKLEESKEDVQEKNNEQDSRIFNQVSEVDSLKQKVEDLEKKLNGMKSRQNELNLQIKRNKANEMPRINIILLLLIAVGLTYLN